jgi:hypothetical protein
MPSKSPAQAKLMRAVAHGWEPPGRKIPVAVGKEFVRADEQKKAHTTREGRADRKQRLNDWAEGKK